MTHDDLSTSDGVRRIARITAVGLILILTLPPETAGGSGTLSPWCLVCGAWGTADLILNVFLFVPLGLAVARPGRGPGAVAAALLAGATLSGFVESVQFFVPGRYPTLADVVANGTGAAAGGILGTTHSRWLRPSDTGAATLSFVWGGTLACLFAGTAYLLIPAIHGDRHRLQWAPALEQYATFPGTVLSVAAGRTVLHPGPLEGREIRALEHSLAGERSLLVTTRFGAPPPSLAPVLRLTDRTDRDVLVLGQDGRDLVLRLRRRADYVRLRRPELRAGGVLAGVRSGDSATVGVHPGNDSDSGNTLCLQAGSNRRCGLGFPVGRGWALLVDLEVPDTAARSIDIGWIAALVLPLGLWFRPSWRWGIGLSAGVAGLIFAPAIGPVVAAGWAEAAGVVGGLASGFLVRAAQSSPSSP